MAYPTPTMFRRGKRMFSMYDAEGHADPQGALDQVAAEFKRLERQLNASGVQLSVHTSNIDLMTDTRDVVLLLSSPWADAELQSVTFMVQSAVPHGTLWKAQVVYLDASQNESVLSASKNAATTGWTANTPQKIDCDDWPIKVGGGVRLRLKYTGRDVVPLVNLAVESVIRVGVIDE